MSKLQYSAYPGFGDFAHEVLGYNQAVRIGDKIELSGQGGWLNKSSQVDRPDLSDFPIPDDIDAQVDQAFANVDASLKAAGCTGWEQVYRITAYLAPLTQEGVDAIVKNLKDWMPYHKPICTLLGVEKLALDNMKVEIEVVAYDP